MPYRSLQQERFFHSAGAKRAGISPSTVKEFDQASKGLKLPRRAKKKKKAKIVVDNKMKGSYGEEDPNTGKIRINVKAHKGDKAELASTVKHELLHAKHPKMTEKEVYKRTAKTKIPYAEQQKLLAKLRNKKINYKMGAAKRRFKIKGKTRVGDLITNMNAQKTARNKDKSGMPKNAFERTALMGAI